MDVTIVTPSLNRRQYIRAALDSLADQGESIEHIIVDGGSSDGTIDLIRQDYPQAILIVEKDQNLYDAINKGLLRASGDIIGLLNTDDQLLPGAVAAMRSYFATHPSDSVACGGCEIRPAESNLMEPPTAVFNSTEMKALRAGDIISGQIMLNGRFFRRKVFHEIGLFNTNYPVFADRDFLARCFLHGMRMGVLDKIVYAYGAHPQSLTFSKELKAQHIAEATALARSSLQEAQTPSAKSFYRRWHGWAAGYELLRLGSNRRSSTVLRARVIDAFATDAAWPLHFLRHLAWHLRTRRERRWHSPFKLRQQM